MQVLLAKGSVMVESKRDSTSIQPKKKPPGIVHELEWTLIDLLWNAPFEKHDTDILKADCFAHMLL